MTTNMLSRIDTSATLPAGYSQRAATLEDAEAVARVITAVLQARGEDDVVTGDLILRGWDNPRWDLATSSQVVLNPQGEMIAYVAVSYLRNPTHPGINISVMPGDHWEAVMGFLMAWGEQRALQALEKCQHEERFAPATVCDTGSQDEVFLESLGYKPARYFYDMSITLQDPPTVMPLPAAFTIRSLDYPSGLEALAEAYDDMWRDHYGYVQQPIAEIVADWTRFAENSPHFDPNMWYIANDTATGEIAGLIMCMLQTATNPAQGLVALVGVRRAYRKQGLAQAMLTHAFAEFWNRDQKTIILGVDANSPTGATRLYERVGMAVVKRYALLEKELRPGIERMNTGH